MHISVKLMSANAMLLGASLITVLAIFDSVALLNRAFSHPLTALVIETVQGRLLIHPIQFVSLLRNRHLTLLNNPVTSAHSV
jgi:hypothetical protein